MKKITDLFNQKAYNNIGFHVTKHDRRFKRSTNKVGGILFHGPWDDETVNDPGPADIGGGGMDSGGGGGE